jgi:hypothetical protein
VFVLAHLLRGTTTNLVVLLVGQGIDGIASAFLYQVGCLGLFCVVQSKGGSLVLVMLVHLLKGATS